PETLEPLPGGDTWSDYLGQSVYADYTVAQGGAVTELMRYRPGHWQHDALGSGTMFYHANHLGTTRTLTDDAGAVLGDANRLYTAFGVPVTAPTTPLTRYGFAGAWGYQAPSATSVGSPESSGLLHVGARYYDPALGRFLQRDPIGVAGGLNAYAYVRNSPLAYIDPSGLTSFPDWHSPSGRDLLNRMGGKAMKQHYDQIYPPPSPHESPVWPNLYLDFTGGDDSWM
ncbi:MAG: RHS repeat-associated core domain-containing protein, partial [bacterium]|nr:RHS repeat-associated core domain-containing protein [bacterium]